VNIELSLSLKEAYDLVPIINTTPWNMDAGERSPSAILLAILDRLAATFSLTSSEAAKLTLIDALLTEITPHYATLRIWKGEPLEAATVVGVTDFLIAPRRGYVQTPLLCAIEAKRDDFFAGETQCIAEMAACRDNNIRDGHDLEVHGIVSNGQGWVFYRLTRTSEVWVSGLFTMNDLPTLLGALDFVIASCAANIPEALNQP
jgi:hypothetical protein